MRKIARKIYTYIINPPSDAELNQAWQQSDLKLPVIWLLGKTGSGKSTIVQKLTGESRAEIGNGFMPCTRDSSYYDYPHEHPILRFLDTRGLGEIDYEADADLQSLGNESHALLLVMRLLDGEQSALMAALKEIRKAAHPIQHTTIIAVHTGADEVADKHDRARIVDARQTAIETAWGSKVDSCCTGFGELSNAAGLNDLGEERLRELIANKVPELSLWIRKSAHRDAEQINFERLKTAVLWYAGTAAASDAIPVVGLMSVPSIQGKMLHSLAQKYGVNWGTRNFSEFTAALGTGFALRYATSLGGRQLAKLIPGFGQLAGSAFAMSVSYASTYALGRAACSYLYYKKTATKIEKGTLQSVYDSALKQGRKAGKESSKAARK